MPQADLHALKTLIYQWGEELGFQQIGISDVDIGIHGEQLKQWLQQNYHGDMQWMETNLDKRCQPELLHEGTLRVITARMDYRPTDAPQVPLPESNEGLISCYAQGRDYHKTIRSRLSTLSKRINDWLEKADYKGRPFVDSAPVLERAMAEKSGMGWIGKNTMLINKDAGSWFFLGELFTNLPLPLDDEGIITTNNKNHCGTCTACMDACPTNAFVEPYILDARRCISYLTIEYDGVIPEEIRPMIGNRIYGCDDCQVVCPWNKFSTASKEEDFEARSHLLNQPLSQLLLWSEEEFLNNTEGNPIRRTGYQNWLRNIAVALGNAEANSENIQALQHRLQDATPLLAEHLHWALKQLTPA